MISIFDRSTLSEAWQLLVIGIVLIAGVFFATDEFQKIVSLICDLGIEPSTAILVTVLQLPNTVVFCLPAGVLLATGVVLWRRTFDYEVLALSVSGLSPARIIAPFFVMSIVAGVFSFWLSDTLVPESRKVSNKLFLTGALHSNLPKSEKCLTFFQYQENQDKLKHILLAGKSLDKSLHNVIIFDLARAEAPKIIWAKRGLWNRGQWQLFDGHVYEMVKGSTARITMTFKTLGIDAISRMTEKFGDRGPLPTEMTTRELKNTIDALEAAAKTVPDSMMVRYLRRLSQPAACVLLSLAALPLCIATPRRRTFWPLAYIGVVVAGYFVSQQICLSLGDNGRLAPLAAAWLPGVLVVFVALATFFFVKSRN